MRKTQQIQRRKPKQARSLQKYNEILDAAARVLGQFDYTSATMQEISLESGHPYSTIYQYFSNKEDIFLAWLERFIDSSLFGLSTLMAEKPDADLDAYIEDSVYLALSETLKHQLILRKLFDNMPLITSKLIALMEARAIFWLKEAFGIEVHAKQLKTDEQKLLTAIRAGNGYWLQIALNPNREINIALESINFATLVKAILL